MDFEAILFDCDGVLVDSERIYVDVERDHLSRIGLNFELDDYMARFQGLGANDFHSALDADYRALGKGPLPESFWPDLDAATKLRMDAELVDIRGIKPLLEAHTGPRAVASSSSLPALIRKLGHTGLSRYFEPHIYSGEQVENGKPAPDLFLFAAGKLGIAPERCLVIEDSSNGVIAGLAAGMTVWGFTGGGHCQAGHGRKLRAAGADLVIADHGELAARLNGG
ncbi:haloacid dehalogenase [Roseibium aquae]|uniref:Haloacid dehalogenase n=1 Tax=Roseibium aquae TaxID=1323746 RepID=A0A916TBL7_9HYPH|nr:HAD family hydrolase [Roseibium aquae]GGB39006.1 haloacid dehalogenase [Roseibium aquae]